MGQSSVARWVACSDLSRVVPRIDERAGRWVGERVGKKVEKFDLSRVESSVVSTVASWDVQ